MSSTTTLKFVYIGTSSANKDLVLEMSDETTIYDIKQSLVRNDIGVLFLDKLFIYNDMDGKSLCNNADYLQSERDTYYYKVLASACNQCLKKPVLVIGDCNYCKLKYCGIHRLPEAHNCVRISDCKRQHHEKNTKNLIENKIHTSKV